MRSTPQFLTVLATAVAPLVAAAPTPHAPGLAAQEAPLVYIDPGHGGDQPGVVEAGLVEADLVLRLGFHVADAFAAAGYRTHMSRTGDAAPGGFQARVEEAEAMGAAVFLGLHMTRDDDPQAWGTELFLAEDLAPSVAWAESLAEALSAIGSQVVLIGQPWAPLRSETMPTLMVELGHLSNPVERRLLTSPGFWEEASAALVEGTGAFLEASGR